MTLTAEWYKQYVRAIGMVNGNSYDKEHVQYDSDSPPRLAPPPRKKQRRIPNTSHFTCEICGKHYKTAASLKGHHTRVHAERPMMLID